MVFLDEGSVSEHIGDEVAVVDGPECDRLHDLIEPLIRQKMRHGQVFEPTRIGNKIGFSGFVHTYAPKQKGAQPEGQTPCISYSDLLPGKFRHP